MASKSTRQKRPGFSRPLRKETKRASARVRSSTENGDGSSPATRSDRSCVASSRSATTGAGLGNARTLLTQLIVAFTLDAMRQVVTAGLHDAPVDHDVHDVGNDIR